MTNGRPPLPRPPGLGARGGAEWDRLTALYVFRPDEVQLVREYGRTPDVLERLHEALAAAPTMVHSPSQGEVPNRLITEIRQQRNTLPGLRSSLELPDEDGG